MASAVEVPSAEVLNAEVPNAEVPSAEVPNAEVPNAVEIVDDADDVPRAQAHPDVPDGAVIVGSYDPSTDVLVPCRIEFEALMLGHATKVRGMMLKEKAMVFFHRFENRNGRENDDNGCILVRQDPASCDNEGSQTGYTRKAKNANNSTET